jgi:hypothetical protein
MKNILFTLLFLSFTGSLFSQTRNINKLTLETTYSQVEIHSALRDFIDNVKRENYFNDDFFNEMLKKVMMDERFSSKEKVQLFYLMQKKIGYAFVGVNYIPPKQNYFIFHLSKKTVLQKTKSVLNELKLDASIYMQIADSHQTNDPIISSNAMLLAALLDGNMVAKKLAMYSTEKNILSSKNPAIFNHYVCLSASIINDSVVMRNLSSNLMSFKQEAMIEDVICALYSWPRTPVSQLKDYILHEINPENDLAIQTALCALETKINEKAFKQLTKSLVKPAKVQWKKDLLENIFLSKVPFNYSISSENLLVTKAWDYVQVSVYNDGSLISNNTLLEFDPN